MEGYSTTGGPKRTRAFVFTKNNYSDSDIKALSEWEGFKYVIFGKEVGKKCGTPHLQGYAYTKLQHTYQSLCKRFRAWFRPAKTLTEAIEYCKKESQEITEVGTKPMDQKEKGERGREFWLETLQAAREGRIDDIEPELVYRDIRTIEYHRNLALRSRPLEDTNEKHLWYWGAAGTGKSRKAREDHPDCYLKMCNKWFDGYVDHSVILIEDFDKAHHVLGHHLKIWGDRYPFMAEIKGSAIKIRPRLVIVTSNYHPRDIWQDETTLGPIMRRFKCVEFKALCDTYQNTEPTPVPNTPGIFQFS